MFHTTKFKQPYFERHDYPIDFDSGSLRYTRPKTGIDIFPTQDNATVWAKLGLMNGGEGVSGFLPLQDHLIWAQGYGKDPYGPVTSALPSLAQADPFSISAGLIWQTAIPGLNKQSSP